MNKLITVHFTSYNRLNKLKSCINSFLKSTEYDKNNIELIIVDNGSKKDVTDFIIGFTPDVKDYKYILNEKNDYPSCLRYAKIQARSIAKGKYYVDIPDDHLFIIKNDWVEKSIYFIENTNNASCVINFAYPEYRFKKANNKMTLSNNNNYFESIFKGYGDYNVMEKATYEKIGEYNYKLGRLAESDYMIRSFNMGYRRYMAKYPVAIINDNGYSLKKCLEYNEYVKSFLNIKLPLSNEKLINYALNNGSIK